MIKIVAYMMISPKCRFVELYLKRHCIFLLDCRIPYFGIWNYSAVSAISYVGWVISIGVGTAEAQWGGSDLFRL